MAHYFFGHDEIEDCSHKMILLALSTEWWGKAVELLGLDVSVAKSVPCMQPALQP